MRLSPAVLRSFRPLIGAAGIAGLACLGLPASAALAQEPTPMPTMEPGDPCTAVVTYSWDASALVHLAGVHLELKDAPFVNPDGLDDDQLWRRREAIAGSRQIDLRTFGPVLDGTTYYFRVIGRGGGGSPPSEAIVFALDHPVDGAYSAEMDDERNVTVSWNLPQQIAGCADRVVWEVKSGTGFAGDWPDPGSDASGETATSGASSGSAQATLPTNGGGEHVARVAARHGGTDPASAVGRAGTGVAFGGPLAVVPRPTLRNTQSCPAVVTVDWDVSAVPGATGVAWELKRGSDFTVPDGDEPGALGGEENGVVGSLVVDLRNHGPVLDGTVYFFRLGARGSAEASGLPRSESFPWGPRKLPGVNDIVPVSARGDFRADWLLSRELEACADRMTWEVRRQPNGTEAPLASGEVPVSGSSGSITGRVPNPGLGDYHLRLAAYHGAVGDEERVGAGVDYPFALLQTVPMAVESDPETVLTTRNRPTELTPAPRGRVLPPRLRMEEYVYTNTWVLALLEHAERYWVGYRHRAVLKQGQGCFLTGRGNAVGTLHTAPLTPGALPTTCEFHWLTGKPVVDPWTIESVEVNARIRIGQNWYPSPLISCQVESIDQEGGGIVVVGVLQPKPNAVGEGRCLIEEIRLRGPADQRGYKDAFQ